MGGGGVDVLLSLARIHFPLVEVRGNRDDVLLPDRKVTHWGTAVGITERFGSMTILLPRRGGEHVRARLEKWLPDMDEVTVRVLLLLARKLPGVVVVVRPRGIYVVASAA